MVIDCLVLLKCDSGFQMGPRGLMGLEFVKICQYAKGILKKEKHQTLLPWFHSFNNVPTFPDIS